MQFSVEDLSPVKKKFYIEIPDDVVEKELNNAYQELKKTAKLKGFRQGKVPRSVLEGVYNKQVSNNVRGKIIQDSLTDILKDYPAAVIGEPVMETPELTGKTSYKFNVTFEVKPEIPDLNFKDLSLKKPKYVINDEQVDAQIEMIRRNMATKDPIQANRPVQKDDFVILAYEAFENGQPFSNIPKTENHLLKVGSGDFNEDFEKELININIGDEKDISVNYPEDYYNKNLAGHSVTFKVQLKEIKEEHLPDLDTDFLKKIGNYETVDDLKTKIREHLESSYEERATQELNEQVFKKLLAKTEFEVPDAMLDFELDHIVMEAERTLKQNNMSFEQIGSSRESFRDKYRETAADQARRHLILEKIVSQEKLEITDEDMQPDFERMATNLDQTVEQIKAFFKQNPIQAQNYKTTLLEKKAMQLILENSTIEDVDPKEFYGNTAETSVETETNTENE